MDINNLLEREQVSLHKAGVATTSMARLAHFGEAAAYGALLADAAFPHRQKPEEPSVGSKELGILEWENEGGSAVSTGSRDLPASSKNEPAAAAVPTPDASRGHVVVTPEENGPYKVILEHEGGADTEQAVATIRAGERLIRDRTPTPPPRDTGFDFPFGTGSYSA
jgi:hypothetical protein